MSDELTLRVSELFYSLQGEGGRAGEPSLFVRLQGCSAKHACFASGVRCDTEFESGEAVSLPALAGRLVELVGLPAERRCRWIVWTGGEPLDQLTPAHLAFFRALGYRQAVETSGVRPLTKALAAEFDWVTLSPKVAEHVLAKTWETGPHELRYVRHAGQGIPEPALKAAYYYLSPHSDGFTLNDANVRHCVRLCLAHPEWRMSVQQHKVWTLL
jgi:organic radical activating enzyme